MQPVNVFDFVHLATWLKWAFVITGALYTFYTLLVLRQVDLMKLVLDNEENPLVSLLAYGHFFAALGLTVLALLSS